MFYDEFSRLTEILVDEPNPLPITGDFNFHVDDSGNLEAMRFLDLLNSAIWFNMYWSLSTVEVILLI